MTAAELLALPREAQRDYWNAARRQRVGSRFRGEPVNTHPAGLAYDLGIGPSQSAAPVNTRTA